MKIENKESILKTNKNVQDKKGTVSLEVQNPIDKLNLDETHWFTDEPFTKGNYLFTLKLFLLLFVVFLLFSSIFLNRYFMENVDPKLYNFLKVKYVFVRNSLSDIQNKIINHVKKPYVLTSGEYADFNSAKDAAVDLLPMFKIIDIKQLNNGIYTLEIERFSSKKQAYENASLIKNQKGLSINVRYLKY